MLASLLVAVLVPLAPRGTPAADAQSGVDDPDLLATPPVDIQDLGIMATSAQMELDTDGNPVILYSKLTDDRLSSQSRLLRCNDRLCRGGDDSDVLLRERELIGHPVRPALGPRGGMSLALDSHDNPVIAFASGLKLRVLRCGNRTCENVSPSRAPVAVTQAWSLRAMQLDANDRPSMVYVHAGNLPTDSSAFSLLSCNDPGCAGDDDKPTKLLLFDQRPYFNGFHAEVVLDRQGRPLVAASVGLVDFRRVLFRACENRRCTGGSSWQQLLETVAWVSEVSMGVGSNGNALVATLTQYSDDQLLVYGCDNRTCTQRTTKSVPQVSGAVVGDALDLAMDESKPFIIYSDTQNRLERDPTHSAYFAGCGNTKCGHLETAGRIPLENQDLGGSLFDVEVGSPPLMLFGTEDEDFSRMSLMSCSLDGCDTDVDGDGVGDNVDNCLRTPNESQDDMDEDGKGNACDGDVDGDGVPNPDDAFPHRADETTDTDGDGIGDNADNCPTTHNEPQADLDEDGTGDACDDDLDGDGTPNDQDAFPRLADETSDTDGDGTGNNADADDDGDGFPDEDEVACGTDPLDPLAQPNDVDGSGKADCLELAASGLGLSPALAGGLLLTGLALLRVGRRRGRVTD